LHLRPDHARDGTAQPQQGVSVQRIGPAEVVNDLRDRPAGFGVSDVVGELIVLGHGAVAVFAFGGPEEHAHIRTCTTKKIKQKSASRVTTDFV
jgi:hypothetical protein